MKYEVIIIVNFKNVFAATKNTLYLSVYSVFRTQRWANVFTAEIRVCLNKAYFSCYKEILFYSCEIKYYP